MFKKVLLGNLAFAIFYFFTAKLGLLLAFEHNQVSPLWPPSGLAVASIFICRNRYVPGILLGAFFANMFQMNGVGQTISFSLLPSFIIGIGNTLEAWLSVFIYRKFVKDEYIFNKINTIIYFLFICGIFGGFIASLIGVSTLVTFGLAPVDAYFKLMLTWWIGDFGGIVSVAPAFIVLKRYYGQLKNKKNLLEFAITLIGVSIVSYFVFHTTLKDSNIIGPSLIYLVVPFIAMAAIRIGSIGAGLINFAVSFFATVGTVSGLGPFSSNPNTTVLLLNIFLASNYLIGFITSSLWNNLKIARLEVIQNAKMAGLGELASTLAHEIGNPVHMIMNYAEIVKRELENPTDNSTEKANYAVGKIEEYSERTQQIIKSNRNFYQNHKINNQTVDLKKSIEKVRELLSIKLRDCDTQLKLSELGCEIEADPLYLEQAFYNLLNNSLNAFMASPNTNLKNEILIDLEKLPNYVDVSISDNGPGIPDEMVGKVFTPFISDKNGENTGIGLSLVASIVAAHNGEIFVMNNKEEGVTFKMRLPYYQS